MFVNNSEDVPPRREYRCSRCREIKPDDAYNSGPGRRDTYCRPCRAAYHREHYLKHRQRYIDQAAVGDRALAVTRLGYLIDYFTSHPCVDCGEDDPLVLEFDHQRDKTFNIGSELRHRGWGSILEEIEKCEVVCANCHRRRTARHRGSVRFELVEGAVESVVRRTNHERRG